MQPVVGLRVCLQRGRKEVTLALVPKVPPLLDYITKISPEYNPPYHLREWCELIERCRTEPLRILCSVPIRHFKTETTLHGVLWLLEHDPTLRIVVMTYDHLRAIALGKRLRVLAKRTDVGPARGQDTIEQWQNEQGGGVVVMSCGQSREGFDCHVLLVDDPLDEHMAPVLEKRDAVDRAIRYYTARCMRRGKPGPIIIVASRFDLDDPMGRRLARARADWIYLHRPAIVHLDGKCDHEPMCDEIIEHAYAPDVWPLEELKKVRAEWAEDDPREVDFWARLQGQPRRHSDSSFGPATRYDWLPDYPGYRDAMGLDMSFSRAKRADFAAIVITRWWKEKCFIRLVHRLKADLGLVASELKRLREEYNLTCPIYTYVSGPERGAVMHLQMMGLPVVPIHAGSPKFVRAQRTIDAHNAGRIYWPNEPWVTKVLRRFENWKGNEDDPDDECDALVSVYDGCASSGGGTRSLGAWRY